MSGLALRDVGGRVIHQRLTDGYVNGTMICLAHGKRIHDYLRLESTKAFLDEMSRSTGIPVDYPHQSGVSARIPVDPLIQKIIHGANELRGSWVHPKVAIHLAQWCDPRFAVQVTDWIFEWLTERVIDKPVLVAGDSPVVIGNVNELLAWLSVLSRFAGDMPGLGLVVDETRKAALKLQSSVQKTS